MTVSVIVPIFGVEAWIERFARSLLSQTWTDTEFIFVNDSTPDHSMEVLERVLTGFPGKKVITVNHEKNLGLPQARLSGLKRASGEYILNADPDDWMEPQMVEKMATAAMASNADVVYCDAIKETTSGSRVMRDKEYSSCKELSADIMRFRAHGYLWNKLIRRSLLSPDLFYPTIGMHEDMVLLCQVLGRGGSCKKVNLPLYHYNRQNVSSMSHEKKHLRDVASATNFLQLLEFWEGRKEDIPFRDSLPQIILRCGFIAMKYAPSILEEHPLLRRELLLLSPGQFGSIKERARLYRVKKWLGSLPFKSSRILCCIFNYNENPKAEGWANRLSPYFHTVILDSGSNPPCKHPLAVNLDNIYYSGLMNEAYSRAVQGGYPWVVVLTSDLGISERAARALCHRMDKLSYSTNVGLYQPANGIFSKSHSKSKASLFGGIRKTNFQEGWFHMARTDLLGRICPVDLSVNRLGWGLDMGLSYFANHEGRLILVDSDITVSHPSGTGYNRKEANRQMNEWFQTIPGFEDPFHMEKAPGGIEYQSL